MSSALVSMPVNPKDRLRVRRFYPFEEGGRRFVFVVHNAAFVEADDAGWDLAHSLIGAERADRPAILASLTEAHGKGPAAEALMAFQQLEILVPHDAPELSPSPVLMEPLASLVLHVAHDCNLRCGYCYADYGRYGDRFGAMDEAMAKAHIDAFFAQLPTSTKRNIHVTFFGGEPLLNMPVVVAAHAYVKARAEAEGRKISFGLTTNGTLLTDELVAYFKEERFTITVSVDGPKDVNDAMRPMAWMPKDKKRSGLLSLLDEEPREDIRGQGSYELIIERVRATGIRAIGRVTLTRQCTDVARIVRELVDAGFSEVGVSPVATGKQRFDLDKDDLAKVLEGFKALADDFVAWAAEGKLFPFSNLKHLVEQIAAGDPRGMPCGAGTALVAADNKGDLYACHRLVGEEKFKMGSLETGVDEARRFDLIKAIQPKDRAPCEACWARYLCGGGCHHIAWLHSDGGEGQPAPWSISDDFCDFLRDWYRLGLTTYARVVEVAPGALSRYRAAPAACSQPSGL